MKYFRNFFIIFLVAIFAPALVVPHFIWPLKYCVLADFCNHTWIPECGVEITNVTDYRLFIDECDMFEYNCDYNRSFEIANYSDCFGPVCVTHNNYYRMGNYKFVREGRKMIYDPTYPSKGGLRTTLHVHRSYHVPSKRVRYTPNLPARMLHGKRRYTPEARRMMHTRTTKKMTWKKKITKKKQTTKKLTTTKPITMKPTTTKPITINVIPSMWEEYVIKREMIVKDGRKMIKVVKGFRKPGHTDSDFIE